MEGCFNCLGTPVPPVIVSRRVSDNGHLLACIVYLEFGSGSRSTFMARHSEDAWYVFNIVNSQSSVVHREDVSTPGYSISYEQSCIQEQSCWTPAVIAHSWLARLRLGDLGRYSGA